MKHFACDFEATTPPKGFVFNDSEASKRAAAAATPDVYLAAALDVDNPDSDAHIHYSIREFMKWVFEQEPATFWFHNLANYDGWFILSYLLRNGFKHVAAGDHNYDNSRFVVGDKNDFTVYDLTTGMCHNFYDSRRLITGSIRSMGEALGHTQKGDETPLVELGSSLTSTRHANGEFWSYEEAIDYIDSDVRVLAHAMVELGVVESFESGLASQAGLANAAMRLGRDPDRQRLKEFRARRKPTYPSATKTIKEQLVADGVLDSMKSHARYLGGTWSGSGEWMPKFGPMSDEPEYYVLPGHSVNKFPSYPLPNNEWVELAEDKKEARKRISAGNEITAGAYKGGFNWVNPNFAGEWVGAGVKLDINSMYPWIYSTKRLPRVVPSIITNTSVKDLTTRPTEFGVLELHNVKANVKPGRVPVLKPRTDAYVTQHEYYARYDKQGNYIGQAAVNGTYSPELSVSKLTLTTLEVDYLLENYDIESCEVGWSVWYKRDEFLEHKFKRHCATWMEQKRDAKDTGDKFREMYAKMMLNSVYGKLGEYRKMFPNPEWVIGADGSILTDQHHQTSSGRVNTDLPAAAFITAYGRIHLANTINEIGLDKFLYCDTDSVLFLGSESDIPDSITVHPSELGAWDLEGIFTDGLFIKCKTYGVTDTKKGWRSTAAGFTRQIPKEKFKPGMTVFDMRPVETRTGTLLCDYKMKVGTEAAQIGRQSRSDQVYNRVLRGLPV